MANPKLNFVRQQGFADASADTCSYQFPALMWQPRVTGILVLAGLLLQSGPYFLALSAILWWNVVFPRLNVYDVVYNNIVAKPRGLPGLTPAPAPRRFSQGMAGTFMLGIGTFLMKDWRIAAGILEGFLVVALIALLFGKLCLGSYIYLFITGRAREANATLPWAGAD